MAGHKLPGCSVAQGRAAEDVGPSGPVHCYCVVSEFQHSAAFHSDLRCCWCGEVRCFVLHAHPVEGHGPYRKHMVLEP